MSAPDAFDFKEQVRAATEIVDLVGSYVPLRRNGRIFAGICPWHDDAKPSLQVNPERQSFKCWVCNIGGDVFSFVMKIEGVEFREALQMLAERGGVRMPTRGQAIGNSHAENGDTDKQSLYRAVAWAEEQYHRYLLEAQDAQIAREYLVSRQISDDSIRRFHIGFAPNRWDFLCSRAESTDWSCQQLERAGLVARRDRGDGYYDRFRGRVMFSIRDTRARPIAFGGRILPELANDRTAKYINSPETSLFSKSKEFYGLDLARGSVAKSGELVIMEGYTDCIMAHQHGIDNVVAVLGTALGERHIPVVRRYSDSIVLVLDGDEAGRKRASEILEVFVANQINLRILTLPNGEDPCDVIASQGSESFRQLICEAVDALEHKLRTMTNGLDLTRDTHRSTQAVEEVLSTLAKARPGAGVASSTVLLREQQMVSRIARQFRLPESHLRERLVSLRRQSAGQTSSARPDQYSQTNRQGEATAKWLPWERELIELILLDPDICSSVVDIVDPAAIESPIARKFFTMAVTAWRAQEANVFRRVMDGLEDVHEKSMLVSLDEQSLAKANSDTKRRVTDLLSIIEHQRKVKQSSNTTGAVSAELPLDDDEQFIQFVNESRQEQSLPANRRST